MLSYQMITSIFKVKPENILVQERTELVTVKFQCNSITFSAKELKRIYDNIPQRDNITIDIIYGEDEILQIKSDSDNADIESFLQRVSSYINCDDDDLEVEIHACKTIQSNELSVYFFKAFSDWLYGLNTIHFIQAQNFLISNCTGFLRIMCLNDNIYIHSDNFSISHVCNEYVESEFLNNRDAIVNKRNQICRVSGIETSLIPEDFNVRETNCGDKVKLCYAKAKFILSIAYLADECKFEEDNFSFSLSGYRIREKTISYSALNSSSINDTFYSIYKWLYAGGNIHDKSQIVRNIISLHCKYSDILGIDHNVFDTIKSNYNLYLKDNVKDYLQLKKDISNSLQTYCDKISESINTFTGSLKTNFIAILGYIATILFSKGITKDTSKIFTPDIAVLTSFVLLGSIIILVLCRLHISFQKNYYDSTITALKTSYQDIMEKDEINGLINNNSLLDVANTNYLCSTRIVSIVWLAFIIGSFIALDSLSGNTKLLFFINIF